MTLSPIVQTDDRVIGLASAPVTFLEFGDYQCPYCGKAQPIVKALLEEYGSSVRYVFRNYPLTELHRNAMNAALVAESADTEDFWLLHDTLFDNQEALDPESLINFAVTAGVSENDARAALHGSTRSKVAADMQSGDRSGVQGTPTFYINGSRHDGDWGYDALREALREAGAIATKESRQQSAFGREGRAI